jgi:hypothetical protein
VVEDVVRAVCEDALEDLVALVELMPDVFADFHADLLMMCRSVYAIDGPDLAVRRGRA